MRKTLIVSVILILLISSASFAASTRWRALGGDHRFIIDTTNYTLYPGRITMFGDALFVIPVPNFLNNDVAAGAVVNVMENMTLAYHYNLASAGASNLRNALAGLSDPGELDSARRSFTRADEGSPEWLQAKEVFAFYTENERLAALDIKPFPDLFWGMNIGNISLGARLALAMDSDSDAASIAEIPIMEGDDLIGMETKPVEEITTKAQAFDLNLGATMYKTPAGDLDLGLSVGMQSFKGDDPNDEILIESTGGMDMAFNARLNKPLGEEKNSTLVSMLRVNAGSLPSPEYDVEVESVVTETSYLGGDIGVGFRRKIKEKGMLVAGVVGGYDAKTHKPTITVEKAPAEEGGEVTLEEKELPETTDTNLSATVLSGCEFPIKDWLIVRGGVSMKLGLVTDEVVAQEEYENWLTGEERVKDVVVDRKSTSVNCDYNMGIRTVFGGLIIDVLLARNILHRGPYFITGAGGNWGTHICVTYMF